MVFCQQKSPFGNLKRTAVKKSAGTFNFGLIVTLIGAGRAHSYIKIVQMAGRAIHITAKRPGHIRTGPDTGGHTPV